MNRLTAFVVAVLIFEVVALAGVRLITMSDYTGARHFCTVRDIQRNVTTIRTGRLMYEGRDIVCELGGE